MFDNCDHFGIENGVSEGREVLNSFSGGGALHCDKVWGRGQPPGPDSLQKQRFGEKLLLHAEEVSSVYTQEISSAYSEEISVHRRNLFCVRSRDLFCERPEAAKASLVRHLPHLSRIWVAFESHLSQGADGKT